MRRNIKIIAGAAVVGLVAAGGAFAFWTASGSGAGSMTTDSMQPLAISGAPSAKLFIGETITLSGGVTNPNPGAVSIKGITAALGTLPTGCEATWFTITPSTTPLTVAAGGSVTSWSGATIKLENLSGNQDACQGLAVPLTFSVAP